MTAGPPARLGTGLGVLSILALLCYPHPVAALGVAGVLALAAVRWRAVGRPLPESPFAVPFALYLAGAVVGWYATVSPDTTGIRLFGLLAAVGTFYLVLARVTSLRAARKAVAVALAVALVGVAVLLLALSFRTAVSHGLREQVAPLWDTAEPWWRRAREVAAVGQQYRITSAGVGMLASYGAGLALGLVLAGATRRVRLLGLGAASYCGVFLLLTGSRTAQLSTALALSAVCVTRYRRIGAIGLLASVLATGSVAGLLPALPDGPARLLSPFGASLESFQQRLEIWQNTLFLLSDFPFTGVGLGLGSPQSLYRAYFSPAPFAHAHNMFAQSYLEQGLLGAAGLSAIAAVGLVVGWRSLARSGDPAARGPVISSAAASLALMLNGLTEIGPLTTVGMVLLFGTLALLVAAGSRPDTDAAPVVPLSGRAAGAVSALVAVTVLLAALASRPRPVAAELFVNLGTLHVAQATLGRPDAAGRRQHLEAACAHLERARAYDPGNPAVHRHLATVALASARPSAARRFLAQAEALAAPEDGRARFQVARLYQASGDVDRAILAWARVDPRIGAANRAGSDVQLVEWGGWLVQNERWSDAVKVNRAAVSLAPANPVPYRALALAVTRVQGDEGVLATMRGLAAAHPGIPWPYEEIAQMYVRLGRGVEARAWDEQARVVWRSAAWATRAEHRAGGDRVAPWRERLETPVSPAGVGTVSEPAPRACGPAESGP